MPIFYQCFEGKIVVHLFWILLISAYPPGLSKTILLLLVHCNFKVSNSARCVSVANELCRRINIFKTIVFVY
jgi:hypothetical protein